tara:strand:+ start:58 stop:843 length:786 start_codon:yes stop_codon:yes gene_type:complete
MANNPLSFEGAPVSKGMPLFPFAPMIYYYKLPMELVRSLNKYANKTIKDEKKAKALDHAAKLVGKVKQEFVIEQKELERHTATFNQIVGQFLNTDLSRHFQQLPENTGFGIHYKSAWIVRQFAGEYNPAHVHTECDMSCVGYLKLPPEIDKEWEKDYEDHYPGNGHIEFIYGQPGRMSTHTVRIKPAVGDFFVFPGDLIHTVYPFTSDGERRSFSMNLSISQETLDENGKFIPRKPEQSGQPPAEEGLGHAMKDFKLGSKK